MDDPRRVLFATPARPTIGNIFTLAHQVYGSHWGLVVGVSAVAVVLNLIVAAIGGAIDYFLVGPDAMLSPASLVLQAVFGTPLVVGPLYVVVRIFRGEQAGFGDMFVGFQRWGVVAGVGAIAGVINFVMLIPLQLATMSSASSMGGNSTVAIIVTLLASLATLFVALWINIRLYFAPILCVDPNGPRTGAVDSIKTSWTMTAQHTWALFVVAIALGIIATVTLLLLLVPFVLYGGPVIACAGGVAYALIGHRTGLIPLAPYTECPYCEYDLSDTDSDRCPECGNFVDPEAVGGDIPLS